MNDDLRRSWRDHWNFATPFYFNHGSFGLTPVVINALQDQFRAEMNADRDDFFWFKCDPLLQEARLAVASFVNAPAEDIVLVDHVTEAVNSVIKSFGFRPGDEILITSHSYPSYQYLYEEVTRRTGAVFIKAEIPFPLDDPRLATAIIAENVTRNTRLAIIDHITSPTALLLPIDDIVAMLKERGVETLVDGAHAAGQVPLDMQKTGAAFYTSNHHKWLSAPVQSGFLYVRPDMQRAVVPAVGSVWSGTDHKFTERFEWQGTKDPSARLCLPETIRYMGALYPQGWPGIYRRNHELAVAARQLLCERLALTPGCPDDMVPCMFSLSLGNLRFGPETEQMPAHMRLGAVMRQKYGYGVYCTQWGGSYVMRVTAHLYNRIKDYEHLAEDLAPVLQELRG